MEGNMCSFPLEFITELILELIFNSNHGQKKKKRLNASY